MEALFLKKVVFLNTKEVLNISIHEQVFLTELV